MMRPSSDFERELRHVLAVHRAEVAGLDGLADLLRRQCRATALRTGETILDIAQARRSRVIADAIPTACWGA